MKMKKLLSLLMAAILMITALPLSSVAAFADGETAYAVFDGVDTLTFRYDDEMPSENAWDVSNTNPDQVPWWEYAESITTVVFDDSFAAARPTSTANWFYSFEYLCDIEDISNLNTSNVTRMGAMFCNCSSLTSLDISNFDTSTVQYMNSMFAECSSLTSLDVSSFDTTLVLWMDGMFSGCSSLEYIRGLTGFSTQNVTDMTGMFYECSSLTYLDVSSFDTTNVCDLSMMFAECSSLKEVNVSGFEFSEELCSLYGMFSGDSELEHIYVENQTDQYRDTSWIEKLQDAGIIDMVETEEFFTGCEKLTGNVSGMTYRSGGATFGYACVYGGLFSVINEKSSYAIYTPEDNTLTFYYDEHRLTWLSDGYSAEEGGMDDDGEPCEWSQTDYASEVTTATFDDSYDEARPLHLNDWFAGFTHLSTINNIDFLHTDNIVTANGVFYNCANLTEIDLSNFEVSHLVENWSVNMFYGCSSLETIWVADDTVDWIGCDEVSGDSNMFYGCTSLVGRQSGKTYNEDEINSEWANVESGYFSVMQDVCAYAVFDGVDTLTFRYDDAMPSENAWDVSNTNPDQVPWWEYTSDDSVIKTVVFDESFKAARPQCTARWFEAFHELQTIEHLDYLNTSSVTNMFGMFAGCRSLTSLDVSSFDTSNVTDMNGMFGYCIGLTALDVSNFDTSNVWGMASMFERCASLTSLDLSTFDTSNVEDMDCMFLGSTSLKSVDVSSFDTSNVGDMYEVFENCSALEEVDLSSFDTSAIWGAWGMFNGCTSLKRIWVANKDVDWTSNDHSFDDEKMFFGCESLSGSISGKTYDENDIDSTWANVQTGYFSVKQEAEMQAYAVFDGVDTLTFRYDDAMPSENAWDVSNTEWDQPWYEYAESITTVVFDDSFADARPQSTAGWFDAFERLQNIEGISNLNTSNVTSMGAMFCNCSSLTSLDISNFDTSNVSATYAMFAGCSELTSLDFSGFDTSSVVDMNAMFSECSSLTLLDLSNFDTSNVFDMGSMFYGCTSLVSLDLSGFDIADDIYYMSSMFENCSSLERIWVANKDVDWTSYGNSFDDEKMFFGCESLSGNISGKTYDENDVDSTWANVETGYFSVKPTAPNNQVSLSIGAEIVSNYYIDVDYYADVEGATAIRYRYNEDSENADYVLSAWQEYAIDELDERSEEAGVEGDYVFHVRQAPAQITERVTVELLDEDGETVDTLTFSAIDYCLAMQEDDNYGDLATAMMLYCFASQQYFTDYMQKEGTVDLVEYTGEDADYYKEMLNDFYEPYGDAAERTLQLAQSSDVQFTGMSYVCAPTSRLRLYINGYEEGKDLGDISLSTPSGWKSSTGGLLATKGDGKYFIQVSDINAIDFDKPFTLSFGGATVTCSVTDYALLCVNSDETGTSGYLGKALILYNGKVKEAANRA